MGKKESTKNIKKKNVEKKSKTSFVGCVAKCFFKLTLLSSVLIGLSAVGVYFYISQVPELPHVDLNENWGPDDSVRDTSIRPFRVVFTDSMQEEIRTLFELYRRNVNVPSLEGTSWHYGVNSEGFAEFLTEWIFNYQFKERAKYLNKFDHFKTNIQGLDIHFLRVKPEKVGKNVKVLPILLLHGWPGSIREFYDAIPRLTAAKKGYDFVFEVIAPSLPGFVYSEAPTRPGMAPIHIAVIMRNLMHRLGHTKYYVQGGDFGQSIGSDMATLFPDEVLGFHTNFPLNPSKYAMIAWILGSIWPSFVEDRVTDRMYPLSEKINFFLEEFGYLHLHATKPDTIGIALEDSPVGLASYMLDRMMIFTDPENKNRTQGGLDQFYSFEKLLDNVMLYWDSRCITTSLRLYKEAVLASELEQTMVLIPTKVPTWGLKFRHEVFYQPDWILRWKYPNLVGSTTSDHGGHFAAFERPKAFTDDIFRAVDLFRKVSMN